MKKGLLNSRVFRQPKHRENTALISAVVYILPMTSESVRTAVTARTPVDVRVKLSDHSQSFLVHVGLVRVVPQLPYLLVSVTDDARTRPVALCC